MLLVLPAVETALRENTELLLVLTHGRKVGAVTQAKNILQGSSHHRR